MMYVYDRTDIRVHVVDRAERHMMFRLLERQHQRVVRVSLEKQLHMKNVLVTK